MPVFLKPIQHQDKKQKSKHILTNNLYGVDINEESVEITKLSLWLKTADRNKALTSLENWWLLASKRHKGIIDIV